MNLILIIVLGSMILYQGFINYIERRKAAERERDLLNRLMSRDFTEYSVGSTELQAKPIEKSKKLTELEEQIELAKLKEAQDIYPV